MAEIVDLTADSPPDAPQPADDSAAVVARLELFTGASADAAREALRAHGNDADAAASALLAAVPSAPASDADLAAIRRLRDEENASAPPTPSTSGAAAPKPSVKEMKAAIAAAGLSTADLLERAERGCYVPGTLRELPAEWSASAFQPRERQLCLRAPYRAGVEFHRQGNKRKDDHPGKENDAYPGQSRKPEYKSEDNQPGGQAATELGGRHNGAADL